MTTPSKKLIRRVVNNVRMFEHETCTIGGLVIGLEDDLEKAGELLGRDLTHESGIRAINRTAEMLKDQVDRLHVEVERIAGEEGIEIPTDRTVNGPPGK